MSDPQPGAGDVRIELDGKELVLRSSLEACIKISGLAGGMHAAIQRCAALNFETIAEIIGVGLGANPNQMKQVREGVYRTGLIALHGKCIDFVHIVANGGRPLPEDTEDRDTDADPINPASQRENSTES